MIICIVGPTGVGKTKLSELLAEKYNSIIVNADAMQVYKEMDIGTAKYKLDTHSVNPHYLFDIVSINDEYTVFNYQKDFRDIIEKNKDKNIIIVGGTGFYLKAGLFNYEFEERKLNDYEEFSNQELYEKLKELNKLEGIHINNRRRMISRLNSSNNSAKKDELLYQNVLFIGLKTDRTTLYQKINDRVDEMMKNGLLDEVSSLYKKYGKSRALATAIGYKELISYLDGEITLEEAVDMIKSKSRKYAKRQFTWFNNQMNITWFDTDYKDFDKTINEIISYIDGWNSR